MRANANDRMPFDFIDGQPWMNPVTVVRIVVSLLISNEINYVFLHLGIHSKASPDQLQARSGGQNVQVAQAATSYCQHRYAS